MEYLHYKRIQPKPCHTCVVGPRHAIPEWCFVEVTMHYIALQRAIAAKQYLRNSEWAHKPLQGSEKHHKMRALWNSDCPGILVLHFPHYLEDVAIPQVPME
jgi:hypothetical protein